MGKSSGLRNASAEGGHGLVGDIQRIIVLALRRSLASQMFELRNRVRYAICGIYYLRKAHNDSSASEEVLNIALETSTRALGASYAHGKTLQPTTRGLKGSLAALPTDRQ